MNRYRTSAKGVLRRTLALMLAVCLAVGLCPAWASAEENPEYQVEVAELPGTSMHFAYSDAWFTGDVTKYNSHIASLSMCAAYESGKRETVQTFLESMNYTGVQWNAYYDLSYDMPESASLVAGKKTIETKNGKETLIAVVFNGFNYHTEWAGNFTIGEGGAHEGFQASRDEALRFLKKYISDQGIEGPVRFWISGHSRGGALANVTAAYLSDPSYAYLSGITVDGVYGYCFGAPGTMVKGALTRGEFGNVAAARTEPYYENDTPGEAYTYSGSDKSEILDPDGAVYSGIFNHSPSEDLITLIPPKAWGYDSFGADGPSYSSFDEDQMLYYLGMIDPTARDGYIAYGGSKNYGWKTLDLNALQLVDDTTVEPITQTEMFEQKLDTMVKMVANREDYVKGGYQDALSAVAGLVASMPEDMTAALRSDFGSAVQAGIYSYIAYVKQWYKEKKGQDLTDGEAGAIVLRSVLEIATGESIKPEDFTVDYALYVVSKYLADNVEPQHDDPESPASTTGYTYKTKLAETAFTTIAKSPSLSILGEAGIYTLFCTCSYGSEQDKGKAGVGPDTAKEQRKLVYTMLPAAISQYPDVVALIGADGSCSVKDLLDLGLPIFYPEKDKDTEGKPIKCATAEEAADFMLVSVFTDAVEKLKAEGKIPATGPVADTYAGFLQKIKANPTALREFMMGVALSTPGDTFDIQAQIRTAATFLGQAKAIYYSHHPVIYAAWYMTADDVYPYVVTETEEGEYEKDLSVTLTADKDCTIYYTLDGTDPTAQSTKYTGAISLPQTDKKQEIRVRAIAVRNGKAGMIWEYDYTIEAPVSYTIVSGGGSEWTQGSGKNLEFTAKRSCHDQKTYKNFKSLRMDGKAVPAGEYKTEEGSLILTLPAEYLEKLAVGEHTVTLEFEDGLTAEAKFKVLEKEDDDDDDDEPSDPTTDPDDPDTPDEKKDGKKPSGTDVKTGDDTPLLLLEILMGISLLGAGTTLILKRRNRRDAE